MYGGLNATNPKASSNSHEPNLCTKFAYLHFQIQCAQWCTLAGTTFWYARKVLEIFCQPISADRFFFQYLRSFVSR